MLSENELLNMKRNMLTKILAGYNQKSIILYLWTFVVTEYFLKGDFMKRITFRPTCERSHI